MSIADIFLVLQWWLMLVIIGLSCIPFTTVLFSRFFDKGYILSRILGTILLSYLLFVFGVFQLLQFQREIIVIILLFITVSSNAVYFYFRKHLFSFKKYLLSLWKIILFEELFFLIGLFFWAYIRSFNPEVHGLEKYMDFGFINSTLRSTYFPPKDMWFTPFSINYYYFGHLVTAVLTKLSGIVPSVAYNLMLATIFAECLTASFSLGANVFATTTEHIKKLKKIKPYMVGILSSLLVTLAGNLHILYAFFKKYPDESPVPLWKLSFAPLEFPNAYWYPNATRFIYNTIHEFPIYSWIVADLHGHVLDIPFVLLTIASIYSLFLQIHGEATSQRTTHRAASFLRCFQMTRKALLLCTVISFLLAVMYMTNAWDGIIYMLLFGLTILGVYAIPVFTRNKKSLVERLLVQVPKILLPVIIVVVGFIIFSYPFSKDFKPFVSGVGIICGSEILGPIFGNETSVHMGKTSKVLTGQFGPFLFEKDHCQKSPIYQLIILYGFFTFFVLGLFWIILRSSHLRSSDIFACILVLLSGLLILIPEFIYVKDIYPAHYRANTMFKLVFQAFIILSIVSAYVFFRIASEDIGKAFVRKGYLFIGSFLIILVLLYPYLATKSYYGDLLHYQGLDGLTYLKNLYPDDYAAITWLNKNIQGQPVLLEAQGDSYTDFARVSANTGLPTVLGWTVHEWLWRGTYDIPAPRITEIQTLYETKDIQLTKQLLNKYAISLVFIGNLERSKYTALNEEKFSSLGKEIYSKGQTRIYKLK